ncbi:Os07g0683300 [Oryza sativa Japonica Group]|uniref:Os07g0683300 protein n=1 Tax=Oryza sativa subsp. japonica TaxID=39947 RepID=A0A0P0XA80_ORYSJ|nr:Os07g0683300 [Oryza sativa Japonica Group]
MSLSGRLQQPARARAATPLASSRWPEEELERSPASTIHFPASSKETTPRVAPAATWEHGVGRWRCWSRRSGSGRRRWCCTSRAATAHVPGALNWSPSQPRTRP